MLEEHLIGQPVAARQLETALGRGALHHAYRLQGAKGVGKRLAATLVAQALVCRDAVRPCRTCRDCRAVAAQRHPDLHIVEPEGASISIEQVRALKHAVALRPQQALRQIAVIDPADALSIPAQNSLLKLLEEPPGEALLLLIEQGFGALLPTIRSRCFTLRFGELPRAALIDRAQRVTDDAEQAALAAALARGSFGALDELVAQDVVGARDGVLADLESLSGPERGAVIPIAMRWAAADSFALRLDLAALLFRDLIAEPGSGRVVNADRRDRLGSWRRRLPEQAAGRAFARVVAARAQLARNLNPRIVADALCVDLHALLSEGA
ncbi:MAG TPA: DNA polymerase III subunit delta' [Limnochordia bacterium]|nr:DNA polymerase III subunit delta' [Limnochordia bacterium]